jgi:hypothetical protein
MAKFSGVEIAICGRDHEPVECFELPTTTCQQLVRHGGTGGRRLADWQDRARRPSAPQPPKRRKEATPGQQSAGPSLDRSKVAVARADPTRGRTVLASTLNTTSTAVLPLNVVGSWIGGQRRIPGRRNSRCSSVPSAYVTTSCKGSSRIPIPGATRPRHGHGLSGPRRC